MKDLKIVMLLDNGFASDARVEKEANVLIAAGANIDILCTAEKGLAVKEIRNGYVIHRIIGADFNSPLSSGYREFIKKLVNTIGEFDFNVLHCHDFHMLIIGAEVKKMYPDIMLVYDAHEYLVGWPYYKTSTSWLNRMKGKIVWNYLIYKERKSIQFTDAVITISKGIAERLQQNNRLKTLPTILGNYPEKAELTKDRTYFHRKFDLKPETIIIIHTGTIYHTNKQLDDLCKSLKTFTEVALIFIGNRPRFYEIQNRVESDPTNTHIFFHEYLDDQTANINLISAGDIGIMHIRDTWEAHAIGFSNRFVEFIAAELPVIATPQEFTVEINNQYNCCVFYSENNSNELSDGLKQLLSNIEEYTENAKNAKEHLDWTLESKKLIKLYSSFHD